MGFSLALELLPVQGFVSLSEDPIGFLRHLILPTIALGLVYTALLARITRATMLETLNEDYIRTARAKGLAEPRVLILHALKNASVPIVTTIGTGLALLIGGVVVTDSVWYWAPDHRCCFAARLSRHSGGHSCHRRGLRTGQSGD